MICQINYLDLAGHVNQMEDELIRQWTQLEQYN